MYKVTDNSGRKTAETYLKEVSGIISKSEVLMQRATKAMHQFADQEKEADAIGFCLP